jgi:hypothetical protein
MMTAYGRSGSRFNRGPLKVNHAPYALVNSATPRMREGMIFEKIPQAQSRDIYLTGVMYRH